VKRLFLEETEFNLLRSVQRTHRSLSKNNEIELGKEAQSQWERKGTKAEKQSYTDKRDYRKSRRRLEIMLVPVI